MAAHWELVRNHCIACHSPQTFLRQKGTLATWNEIIAWMQNSGGLPPLQSEVKSKILAYLSINYGPGEEHRRAPIPATFMLKNPYISATRKAFEQTREQPR